MKKVFALLTIVSVMSFVACKNTTSHDAAADSQRVADSAAAAQKTADSIAAAEKAAAEAADTNKTDSGAVAPETK